MRYEMWPRYVSVGERKANTAKRVVAMKKKGITLNPVVIEGRAIAKTFWGKSWCDNLEAYSDFENRLPRGRTYARNGSIIDLQITTGRVKAQVMGSELYQVIIEIVPMPTSKWQELVKACAGKIDSLIELLQGKFSKAVMEMMTQKEKGLFPKPKEISMNCSCPDYAGMCKHVAATLYGVGAILDSKPEWLFDLRHVNHVDLLATASKGPSLIQAVDHMLEDGELSELFDIEMDSGNRAQKPIPKKTKKAAKKPIKEKPKAKIKKKDL